MSVNPPEQAPLHSPPPTASAPKPRGILKNALPPLETMPSNYTGNHLSWDEANIAATDLSGEEFMKITEPKTPYVRYNAELDEVEGFSSIPDFSLTQRSPISSMPPSPHPSRPTSATYTASPSSAHPSARTEAFPVRRPSFGAAPSRPSVSASSGSSRSASFSLPGEEGAIMPGEDGRSEGIWGEVEEDEMMDEEAAKKHAEFVKRRGRHYSNEAEAMKMARMLPEEDDDKDANDDDEERAYPEAEASPAPGATNGNADGASISTSSSS